MAFLEETLGYCHSRGIIVFVHMYMCNTVQENIIKKKKKTIMGKGETPGYPEFPKLCSTHAKIMPSIKPQLNCPSTIM